MSIALIALLSVLLLVPADPASPPATPGWSVITVLPGESLESISKRFCVTAAEILDWSQLEEPAVQTGVRLAVYSTVQEEERLRMRYKLKEDTTWQRLANRYEMSLLTLYKANGLTRGRRVAKGRRVTVYVKKSRWNRLFLDGGVQLREGPGILVKNPQWSWGRPVTVRTIEKVGAMVAARFAGTSLVVGDLSKKRGGRFEPHKSHKGGMDADVGLFETGVPYRLRFRHVPPKELDVERTWFMVHAFIQTGRVERVLVDWYLQAALYKHAMASGLPPEKLEELFQYPAKRWKEKGLIRHWPGHKHHLHFRFIEPEGEPIL